MAKFLGASLVLGSLLVSGVLVWMLGVYRQDGQLADLWLAFIGLVLLVLLVLPQLGLGIYLLRQPPPDDPI